MLRSEDGGFVADVVTLPGVITEAETFSELINMVNDAIITHYEVPEQYRAFLPAYLPPFKAAQDLGLFPVQRVEEEVTLNLAVGEAPTR
ncbi:MAG: hypothetical protein Q8P45_02765 [Candidatus Harrisonbacteria bacterium]|nr:hypothetical protein [Candidatus Harrisonbacteria bacterium]